MFKLHIILFLILISSPVTAQKEYYVSPYGSDMNAGTRSLPFRSIRKARETVRGYLAGGQTEDVTVWIGGGTYRISEPLKFFPEDSGQGDFMVTYRAVDGEIPVISGGMTVTGWENTGKGYWVACLAGDKTPSGFRELFISGERAVRARHPDTGYLRMAAVGSDRRTGFYFTAGDFPEPARMQLPEAVVLHDWSATRIQVAEIDYASLKITAVDSVGARVLDFFNLDNWEKNPRYFLENSLSFLDSPGEWYFDKEEQLLYLMMEADQDPAGFEIVIPVTGPHLLEISGSMENKVRNLEFHR
jgi:hypothetical protein